MSIIAGFPHVPTNTSFGNSEGIVEAATDSNASAPAASTIERSSPAAAAPAAPTVKQLLGDQDNVRNLALRLRGIQGWVDTDFANWLSKNSVESHPDSRPAKAGLAMLNIGEFITALGHTLPTTNEEVSALAHTLEQKAALHPLGNFGGALSWPIPMSHADQGKIVSFLSSDENAINGRLAYSTIASSVTAADLENPVQALQKMLDSPKAIELGKALQRHLGGVSTDTSLYDYVLTAIHIGFDSESFASPERNKIAGFDLLQPAHWGLQASQVVENLSNYLVANGRSSAATAKFVNYLLLIRTAPQFLIKDIPPSITVGSQAWANLCIATAAIEAGRPGTVANMTFAEVMSYSTSTNPAPKAPWQSQAFALIDWAVASGVIAKKPADAYTPAEIERIKTQFNQQLTERLAASEAIYKEIPSRKDMALAKLRELFKDEIASAKLKIPPVDFEAYFEKKILSSSPPPTEGETWQDKIAFETITWETRQHSPLDMVMMGIPNLPTLTSTDAGFAADKLNQHPDLGVTEAFEQQFDTVITNKRRGIITLTQHLISQLPLEDRKNFEYGAASFYQRWTTPVDNRGRPTAAPTKNPNLWVKIEREGKSYAYRFNINDNAIVPVSLSEVAQTRNGYSQQGNTYIKAQQKEFTPTTLHVDNATVTRERTPNQQPFDSFNTSRSINFGKAFSEHLDVDDPTIKSQARGQTPWEAVKARTAAINEFFLDLIPFRSAIVNFQQGKIGAGLLDLTLDAFGFLTAGAGAAGKLTKIGSSALSAGSKTLKAARVIGAATIGALNPVSGLGDLASGGIKLLGQGGRYLLSRGAEAVHFLKGAAGSYEPLKAASKYHGVVATGTYKVAEQSVEAGAVLKDGKWYAYDAVNNRPFGLPLKDFTPNVAALEGDIRAFTETWFGKMISSVLMPPTANPNFRSDFTKAVANAKTTDNNAFLQGMNTGNPAAINGYNSALKVDDLKRLAVAEQRTPQELGALMKRMDELDELPDRLKTTQETAKTVDPAAYKKGYGAGKPDDIKGFSETLTNNQLAELVIARGRTPEEVGSLIKFIEDRRIHISTENFKAFVEDFSLARTRLVSCPQGYYLSQVALLSEGECAALANVMAAATKYGKQQMFMQNLHASLVPTLNSFEIAELRKIDPLKAASEQRRAANVAKFHDRLGRYQEILGKKFHHDVQPRQVPYTTIISELASAKSSKTLLINAPGHGITAGIIVNGTKKEWFYFDPNFGKATFLTAEEMSVSLEKALKSGRTKSLLEHYGNNPAAPEYKISWFSEDELTSSLKSVPGSVDDLFMTPL